MNLKNKKLAMVMGKSIEGCGITRTCSEMQYWCKKNDVELKIYTYDEKTYNRRDAHALEFTSFTRKDINIVLNEINECDVVMFSSYPGNKFEKESIKDFYEKLVKNITTIKVGFMHELNKTNIDKIPYLLGIMNEMDLIYNFGEETWFSQTISKILPSKVVGERVRKFTMWFNFDELEHYRDEVKLEDKEKKLLYLGRWTSMKHPRRVLDLGKDLLDNNIKAELIGIERSIGAKFDIYEHPNCIDMTGKEPKYISPEACVPVYGTYIRNEGMETLSKSLFACSFYRMPKDPEGYGDRMEYTMIEIAAVGAIPVYDKHWGENNKTLDGRRYIDIPYSAIYSDGENLKDTVDQIVKVANDPELQRKYFETSNQIVKQEFDANIVLPKMFTEMLTTGKDSNKYSSDEELIKSLVSEKNQEEFLQLYNQHKDEDIPVLGIRELYENNIFAILENKKEKEIKKFKK